MALVLIQEYWRGNQGFLNLITNANRSIKKRKVHTRPVISPWETKNVMSFLNGIEPSNVSFSHHSVSLMISPEGLIIADMPVFAHLAMALRVSMARRLE